jgi:ribosomal protein L11 methyltransferase
MRQLRVVDGETAPRVLDVGTGSGILAIAAIVLGARWAAGVDLDPAACHEARVNAIRNRVAGQMSVMAGSLDSLGRGCFEVILANLRPPTLAKLMPRMAALTQWPGYWVLSGFRPHEAPQVASAYPAGVITCRYLENRGWAALVANRKSGLKEDLEGQ